MKYVILFIALISCTKNHKELSKIFYRMCEARCRSNNSEVEKFAYVWQSDQGFICLCKNTIRKPTFSELQKYEEYRAKHALDDFLWSIINNTDVISIMKKFKGSEDE